MRRNIKNIRHKKRDFDWFEVDAGEGSSLKVVARTREDAEKVARRLLKIAGWSDMGRKSGPGEK